MTAGRADAPAEIAPFAPEAPALSRDHIRKELEMLHQSQHRTRRSALYARLADPADDGATIEISARGETLRLRIVDTSGELDLRRKLARDEGEAAVYLVPFARRLPRDIEAVLASGRLWWPQIEWLLPRRFGARAGTPRLIGSRLRAVAQREGMRTYAAGDAPSIDLDDAWLLFLRAHLHIEGLETEAQLFAAVLLDRERRGKAVAALLAGVKGAREELEAVLGRRMGASARHVLAAWFEDAAVELGAMAIVGEAARRALGDQQGTPVAVLMAALDQRIRLVAGHPLRRVLDAEGEAGLSQALTDLGYLAPLVWQKLDGDAHEPLRRAVLGEAEGLLSGAQVRPLALGSHRLPFVFDHRCRAFVEAIGAVASAGDASGAARGMAAVDAAAVELLAHDAARGDAALVEQVEMASRLAAFLGDPAAWGAAVPEGAGPHAEVVGLAVFQAEVGGYVDWACQTVRGEGSTVLGRGLQPLVAQVDRLRDALDARFARAYARLVGPKGDRGALRGSAAVGAGRAEVVPIEDALARMGLGLIERGKELRLLVLVMDGMSGANLAELWGSMGRTSFVPVSAGARAPVIAHVPTITNLSRSALFAGSAIAPGEGLDTGRDGDRLAKHEAVKRLGQAPVVLLKGEVLGPGGGLSDDAAAVVKGERRVVAVVVNAIDDALKGSAQLRVTLSTERIRPLRALLDAAESTGRLVLLVSDHGHITSRRFIGAPVRSGGKEIEGAERAARYRCLGAGEAAAPDEIELPAGALVVPKGVDRVAVAVHEAVRYTSGLRAGEHGGASLAEVIAPAVLLSPRPLLPELEALGVKEAPLEPPRFWDRDRARAEREEPATAASALAPAARPQPASGPPVEPPAKKGAQVALPFEPVAPELAEALFRSPLFESQLRQAAEVDRPLVKRAIALLARHGGRMGWDRFAVELRIDTGGKGVRVPGFVDRLEKVLNVDQEPVITMDRRGQTVSLDEGRLRMSFLEDGGG